MAKVGLAVGDKVWFPDGGNCRRHGVIVAAPTRDLFLVAPPDGTGTVAYAFWSQDLIRRVE